MTRPTKPTAPTAFPKKGQPEVEFNTNMTSSLTHIPLAVGYMDELADHLDGKAGSAEASATSAATSESNAAATLSGALTKDGNLSGVADPQASRASIGVIGYFATKSKFPTDQDLSGNFLKSYTLDGRMVTVLAPLVLKQINKHLQDAGVFAEAIETDVKLQGINPIAAPFPGMFDINGAQTIGTNRKGEAHFLASPFVVRDIGKKLVELGISGGGSYDPVSAGLLPSPDIYMNGDSYMSDDFRIGVGSFFDGSRSLVRMNRGGYTTSQINSLIGIDPLTVATIAGGASGNIPASGGVAITFNVNPLYSGGAAMAAQTANVTIGGVAGVVSSDASANLTFTRSVAGSAVAVAAGDAAVLAKTGGTAALFGTEDYRNRTMIFCGDRNNGIGAAAGRIASRDAVLRFLDYQTTKNRRVLIMGRMLGRAYALDGVTLNHGDGTPQFDAHHAYMDMMHRELGSVYFDTNEWALRSLPTELGLTLSAGDNADIAKGCPARQLFATNDLTHTNNAARQRQGYHAAKITQAKGW